MDKDISLSLSLSLSRFSPEREITNSVWLMCQPKYDDDDDSDDYDDQDDDDNNQNDGQNISLLDTYLWRVIVRIFFPSFKMNE